MELVEWLRDRYTPQRAIQADPPRGQRVRTDLAALGREVARGMPREKVETLVETGVYLCDAAGSAMLEAIEAINFQWWLSREGYDTGAEIMRCASSRLRDGTSFMIKVGLTLSMIAVGCAH